MQVVKRKKYSLREDRGQSEHSDTKDEKDFPLGLKQSLQ